MYITMNVIYEIKNDVLLDFLRSNDKSNIFQAPEMFAVFQATKNYEPLYIGITNDSHEIIGSMIAVVQKEFTGILSSYTSRAIIWGGPLIKDDNPLILETILREYNYLIKHKAVFSQFRNLWNWSAEEKEIFKANGFGYEEHLDIIHDLRVPVEKQLMQIHKGRRKNISRAIRKGVQFDEITNKQDLIESFSLLEETYERVSLPLPDKSLFIAAFNHLHNSNKLKIFKTSHKGNIISVRYVLCYNHLLYDWFAGSRYDHLDKYPNDFLPWKIMEWGTENGYKYFDFGGAGKPKQPYGVREHKLKFGGKLVEYGRFEKIHKPFKIKISKSGFYLYKRIRKWFMQKRQHISKFPSLLE